MSDQVILSLVSMEAQHVIKPEMSIVERMEAASLSAIRHWMAPSEDVMFRGAVAAVLLSYPEGSEERERIKREMQVVQKLNAILVAAQAGVGVDLSNLDEDDEVRANPIGLLNIFRRVRKESKP